MRLAGRPTGGSILSDEDFIEEFRLLGGNALARKLGAKVQGVFLRRRKLEEQYQIKLAGPNGEAEWRQEEFPGRLNMSIADGHVVVFGDAHYWPLKQPPLMHRGLIYVLNKLRQEKTLRAVIANGDITDFARLSRFPVVDWQRRPTVRDEISVCTDRMQEIAAAAGKVPKIWPLGNHDARWSIYLARHANEVEGIDGINLKDHFPLWDACWSIMINEDVEGGQTFVKHRGPRGGKNAAMLNVEQMGCSIVTNHLHSAKVIPYRNIRRLPMYGVDTGCIAEVYGPQFLYLEDNPRNWHSAFAVLTFRKSRLLYPELVLGYDERSIQFRGEVIRV